MVKRWTLYLSALLGCLVFHIAYQEWASWIFLLAVLGLPPLSLLLSLPAMLTARTQVQMPPAVQVDTPLAMNIVVSSPFPVPSCQFSIRVYHTVSQESLLLDAASYCPTRCCGALNCKPHRGWIYDYLGMFRLPLRKPASFRILVRPRPLEMEEPDLNDVLVNSWRPKLGGGYAENHELREYRPGDSLSQIHWKLTAKTDKLILREPMVPDQNRLLIWLTLNGTTEEINRKLARLLWLGSYLLRHDLKFEILAYTAAGEKHWAVDSTRGLRRAVDRLLCQESYPHKAKPEMLEEANWVYYIGGEADETA